MLTIVAWSLVLAAVGTTPAGPCDLLDRAAAAQILGAPVTKVEPAGPGPDEDTGATRTTCTYWAGERLLALLRLDFPDAAAARETTAAALTPEKLSEEKATLKPESGIGDKSYLISTPQAVQYVVVKGATVITLIVSGTPDQVSGLEPQLRTAAGAVTKKL